MNSKNSVLTYLIYGIISSVICFVIYNSIPNRASKEISNNLFNNQDEFIIDTTNQNYHSIDIEKSNLFWIGKKIHDNHYGTIKIKNGKIFIKEGKVEKAFLKVDMNSIKCTDIESEEYNNKLVRHLKNQDFFEVDKYPYAVIFLNFKLKEDLAENKLTDTNLYIANGFISIKKIRQSFSENFIITHKNNVFHTTGEIEIDRTNFNIKYKSGTFFPELADKIILDNFTIKFELYTGT